MVLRLNGRWEGPLFLRLLVLAPPGLPLFAPFLKTWAYSGRIAGMLESEMAEPSSAMDQMTMLTTLPRYIRQD
jgi:hypothetical protein